MLGKQLLQKYGERCIKLPKKPLANSYNASLESEIFADQLKTAKVVPLDKKGIQGKFRTTDQ
jgi:hypothetical protein